MTDERHNYEYQIDPEGRSAPARVVRMVGSNKRVLEIGAGPGSITRVLQANGCGVTAVERDGSAIRKLSAYCERVIEADLNDPAWVELVTDEAAFDVVVCADVLEHVYEPARVLVEMASFLSEGTSMVVSLPHVGHSAIHACLYQENFEYRDWGLLDRTHIRFFGIKNIAELFKKAGLKLIDAEFVVCEPEQTEFSARWESLPEGLKRELKKNPYGNVYQVVLKAVKSSAAGDPVELHDVKIYDEVPPARDALHQAKRLARKYISPGMRARIRVAFDLLGIRV